MDRIAVTRVDHVSTTPSVTMLMVPVYRGVVLGSWETSVQEVIYGSSVNSKDVALYSICLL